MLLSTDQAQPQILQQAAPVLVVTATDVETDALHSAFNPSDSGTSLVRIPRDNYTYYCGNLGGVSVVHIQCGMGSSTHGGSILAVAHAIRSWKPKSIIMVGIAFGIDETKQGIADVLISRQIIPYEQKRVGTETTMMRGIPSLAGPLLLNRFSNINTWHHEGLPGIKSKALLGDMLSGEVLIDNKKYRDSLKNEFPTSIGGEMEGAGLAVAARAEGVTEWIVVKGICDFADGNKATDKELRQQSAAKSAVSLLCHVLTNDESFIVPCQTARSTNNTPLPPLNEVLFITYTPTIEPYYQPREIDTTVASMLKQGNLWLWGSSGTGKTVMLQRAANQLKLQCLFVDLSSAVNADAISLLEDAYWQMADFFDAGLKIPSGRGRRGPEYWVRLISSLIANKIQSDTLLIVDEFSLSSRADLELFLDHAVSLVLKLTNLRLAHKLHIALASAYRPLSPGDAGFGKLQERIPLIELEAWSREEIQGLADRLRPNIAATFTDDELAELAIANPRSLKNLIRLHSMHKDRKSQWTLKQTFNHHRDELC